MTMETTSNPPFASDMKRRPFASDMKRRQNHHRRRMAEAANRRAATFSSPAAVADPARLARGSPARAAERETASVH